MTFSQQYTITKLICRQDIKVYQVKDSLNMLYFFYLAFTNLALLKEGLILQHFLFSCVELGPGMSLVVYVC